MIASKFAVETQALLEGLGVVCCIQQLLAEMLLAKTRKIHVLIDNKSLA